MRKYFSTAISIVLAAGFAVATAASKEALVFFSYQLTTYTQAQVSNTTNWREGVSHGGCTGSNRACQIAVDGAYLTGTPGNRLLSAAAPSLVLTAIQGSSAGQYKPVYEDGPEIEIYNKD